MPDETAQQPLLEPQPCGQSDDYTHLRIKAKARPEDAHSVEICGDSGCGRPVVDRTWLQSLEYTIEKKEPVVIRGVSGWSHVDDWAAFTFFIEGIRADGTKAGTAKFTTSAWVQDKLEAVALLGNGFLDPYKCDIINTSRRIQYGVLDDFFIPFDISRARKHVNRRVTALRATVVPAGKTVAVAAAWKELLKDRSFAFCASAPSAIHAMVDYKAPPAVIFVNNTKKDVKLHRKQKIGNIMECSEESYFSSTWTTALAALTMAIAPVLGAVSGQGGELTAFSSLSLPSISQEFPLTEEINAVAAGHHQLNWSTVKPGTARETSVPTSLGDAIF